MTTIISRATKGLPLTHTEVDANFANLNSAKLEFGQVQSAGKANSIPYLNGSKVLTSGTALTFDGTTLGTTGALRIDGNVTLGDASTDTVQVNGYMAVGGAVSSNAGLYIRNTALTGVSQYGLVSYPTATSSATTKTVAIGVSPTTAGASYTTTDVIGYEAANASKGVGSTITNQHGVWIADQTQGTNNYGITSLVSSGTNKWNIYASGTAQNYFAGNLGIGTTSPAHKLSILGATFTGSAFSGQAIGDGSAERIRIGYKDGTPDTGLVPAQIVTSAAALQIASRDVGNGVITFATGTGIPERMRLDASGNLGIGTTSPTVKLDVVGAIKATGTNAAITATATEPYLTLSSTGNTPWQIVSGAGTVAPVGSLSIRNGATGGSTVFDASGNLGLGVTPSAWGSAAKAIQFGPAGSIFSNTAANALMTSNAYFDGTNWRYINAQTATYYDQNEGVGLHAWHTSTGTPSIGGIVSFTQAMTLDASGNLLVGTTATISSGVDGVQIGKNSGNRRFAGSATGSYNQIEFWNPNGYVGAINTNGSATAYNTSSDYRLKNITGPITTSGAYIDSLKPVEGTWKADGSTFVGLIAHETQEASRTTVATGTKDGEEMQGMDYSSAEIIANLIAELQDLRKRLAAAGI